MPRTLLQLRQTAEHAAGDGLDGRASSAAAVNAAGEHLISAHAWQWLHRPPAQLSLVADQSYVQLPGDFGTLEGVSANLGCIYVVTPQEISRRRDHEPGDAAGSTWWAAVAFMRADPSAKSSEPFYALDVYPTPAANAADAWRLSYRARWEPLNADTDVAMVPPWIEPLLDQFVRAYGRGSFDPDRLDDLLGQLLDGPMFRSAIARDGTTQADRGALVGGAVAAEGAPGDGRFSIDWGNAYT